MRRESGWAAGALRLGCIGLWSNTESHKLRQDRDMRTRDAQGGWRWLHLTVLLIGLALVGLTPALAQQQELTIKAAQDDFGAKDYQACLQKISRLLAGNAAKPG